MVMQYSNKLLAMGVLGFVAGILLAPDKGTATRDKIKQKADEVADTARSKKDKAKHKINEIRKRQEDTDSFDDQVEQLVP